MAWATHCSLASHLHFSVPGGLPRTDTPRTDTSVITARQLITSGVTAGRLHLATLDEAIDLKKRSLDPCGAIPFLQVGGPGISGALEKDFNNFQGARTAEEAIGKVQKFSAAGIEWLAIHDAHRFAPGVLPALAGAAKKSGMRGARVLRMTDVGHLRAGARADFVLYRGNVEEGPLDVARVIAVGKGGMLITGEASRGR